MRHLEAAWAPEERRSRTAAHRAAYDYAAFKIRIRLVNGRSLAERAASRPGGGLGEPALPCTRTGVVACRTLENDGDVLMMRG